MQLWVWPLSRYALGSFEFSLPTVLELKCMACAFVLFFVSSQIFEILLPDVSLILNMKWV